MRSKATRVRQSAATAAAVAVMLAAAGCGGSSPAQPDPSASSTASLAYTQRIPQLIQPLVQCFADHHLIPATDLRGASWLKVGKVKAGEAFSVWWGGHAGVLTVNGKKLSDWVYDAARDSKDWPDSICGPMPQAKAAS